MQIQTDISYNTVTDRYIIQYRQIYHAIQIPTHTDRFNIQTDTSYNSGRWYKIQYRYKVHNTIQIHGTPPITDTRYTIQYRYTVHNTIQIHGTQYNTDIRYTIQYRYTVRSTIQIHGTNIVQINGT